MKLKFVLVIAFAICQLVSLCQSVSYSDYLNDSYNMNNLKTEITFNAFKPGKGRANFEFFNLPNKIRFILELSNGKQLYSLPNLDSILQISLIQLQPIIDSFKNDGIVRRIDYLAYTAKPQIRIIEHTNLPNNYLIDNNNISELKIEQDTLRIKCIQPRAYKHANSFINEPFFITILSNNFSNLKQLPTDALLKCKLLLEKNLPATAIHKNSFISYKASFNMASEKLFSPSKTKWIITERKTNELVPSIYASTQLLNGQLSTTIAAGIKYSYGHWKNYKNQLYLMWEPHFFFTNQNNSFQTFRNDFITLRLREDLGEKSKNNFNFQSNISIGYLVGRRGNYFNENTFKIGFIGVSSGLLQLEPEFIFNGFLKNFSPGFKLSIFFE